MAELAVERHGSGPRVVLVHGGLGPEITWAAQAPLAARFELVIPWRRGFGASPATERQDFVVDGEDLAEQLGDGAHLVGFSYGGLGAIVAAASRPEAVHSLTIIESPVFPLARGDPDVDRFERMSHEFMERGLDASPDTRRAFLVTAGMAGPTEGRTDERIQSDVARALGGRLPGEEMPGLAKVIEHAPPALVLSGGHSVPIEKVCDALAEALDAERDVLRGEGHAVQRTPGFNARLERFLLTP